MRHIDLMWELLRRGLWSDCMNLLGNDFKGRYGVDDFSGALNAAAVASVLGIAIDGLNTVENVDFNDGAFLPHLMQYAEFETRHAYNHRLIGELFNLLCSNGFAPVLLKGQGNATFYANPTSRDTGDVDIYIGRKDMERVVDLFRTHDYLRENELTDNELHVSFYTQSSEIELHRYTAILPGRRQNRFYRAFEDEAMQHAVPTRLTDELSVNTPDATFNSFFLFYHCLKQFLGPRPRLKHFPDLARLLYMKSDEIDLPRLKFMLERTDLLSAWRSNGSFLVKHLGLSAELVPFLKKVDDRKADLIRDYIERRSIVGTKEFRPNGFVKGKWFTLRKYIEATTSQLMIFPRQSLKELQRVVRNGLNNTLHGRVLQNHRDLYEQRMIEQRAGSDK